MKELKEKYSSEKKKTQEMTIDQAYIIYKIKLQTYLELMKELKSITDEGAPESYEVAYEHVRPLMIDTLHRKTGGIEWDEFEDRITDIARK